MVLLTNPFLTNACVHCVLMPFLPFLTPWCLTFNSRNMCMFSPYWLCLSCSSLSHACTNAHKYTLRCFEVEKASSSVPPLHHSPSTTQTTQDGHAQREHTKREIRGEEMKGAICSNVAALKTKWIYSYTVQLRVKFFFGRLSCWELAKAH